MKLLRYGPAGQEKPGLVDRDGKIRDLSGTVADIDGATLAPASLDRLRGIDPASLPLVSGTPRLGPCVGRVPKFVAIGLNYRQHAARDRGRDPQGADHLHEGDVLDLRPERRRDDPQGLAKDRLGGRARHRDRQPRALCRRR